MNGNNAYIFASSNLRAKERSDTAANRLDSFINAPSAAELYSTAAKVWGLSETAASAELFECAMKTAVEDVRSSVPDFSIFAPLLYKYDCTNVKLAIKYSILGEAPADKLIKCGCISPEFIINALQKNDWSCLPKNMKEAAENAERLYRETGEARIIDITLDRACFGDMTATAEKGGIPLIIKIVSARADIANLLASKRIDPDNTALFERIFLPGGSIELSSFIKNGSVCSFSELLFRIPASPIREAIKKAVSESYTLAEIEKIFDEAVLSMIKDAKYITYGPEVVVRYLLVREADIMNCRIALAAMNSGINAEQIRERMRTAYV